MTQIDLNKIPKEILENFEKLLSGETDEIEQTIDLLKAKQKESGLIVAIQKECYTTTN